MNLKDYNYELILEYIETRNDELLTPELVDYLSMLEMIRSMHFRYKSKASIIHFLKGKPYELSAYQANKAFAEMMNLFFADDGITKDAWRNAYAGDLDKMAELILATYRSPADAEAYIKAKVAAAKMRQLDKEEPEKLPEELFNKPTKIYTLDPRMVGRDKVDRNLLAQQIDAMDVPISEKRRLRQEAMIDQIEFLDDGEEKDH